MSLGGDPSGFVINTDNSHVGVTPQPLQNRSVHKPAGFNYSSDFADKELDATTILFVGTDSSGEGISIPRVDLELYNFDPMEVIGGS